VAYRAVLLDVDGTLIDSNDAHTRAWVEVLARHGFDAPYEEIRRLIGMGSDKLLPEVAGISSESPRGKQISEERGELFRSRYLPHLKPFPSVRELLERMRADGKQLVIATSAHDEELKGLLKIAGVEDLIQGETSSSDAENSKPDPDIVAAALRKSGCPPPDVVMLGDTPYDVEAARKAGAAVIALRCGGWDDSSLQGAKAIYDDPQDLAAKLHTSPFAER